MTTSEKPFSSENFAVGWRRLLFQGVLLIVIGVMVATSSVLNSEAVVLAAKEFSWLPLTGIIICALGLQECLEAFFSKISREFHQNLQVGILDTVIGALIFLSVSGEPQRLSLMIAAFLIVRGSVRVSLVHALGLPQSRSTTLFGLISIVLGILLFFQWPTTQSWFMSLSLNIEIAFRGWSMMMFALWVRKRNAENTAVE